MVWVLMAVRPTWLLQGLSICAEQSVRTPWFCRVPYRRALYTWGKHLWERQPQVWWLSQRHRLPARTKFHGGRWAALRCFLEKNQRDFTTLNFYSPSPTCVGRNCACPRPTDPLQALPPAWPLLTQPCLPVPTSLQAPGWVVVGEGCQVVGDNHLCSYLTPRSQWLEAWRSPAFLLTSKPVFLELKGSEFYPSHRPAGQGVCWVAAKAPCCPQGSRELGRSQTAIPHVGSPLTFHRAVSTDTDDLMTVQGLSLGLGHAEGRWGIRSGSTVLFGVS